MPSLLRAPKRLEQMGVVKPKRTSREKDQAKKPIEMSHLKGPRDTMRTCL